MNKSAVSSVNLEDTETLTPFGKLPPKADGKVRTTHIQVNPEGEKVHVIVAEHDTHAEAIAWVQFACDLKKRDASEYYIDPPVPPKAEEPDPEVEIETSPVASDSSPVVD